MNINSVAVSLRTVRARRFLMVAVALLASGAAGLAQTPVATSPAEQVRAAEGLLSQRPSAENYLNLSLAHFRAGQFKECIADSRAALKLRPDYAPAWNNIAAANGAMGLWDEAVPAAKEALRLDPEFQLAKNNLAWVQGEKDRADKK